MSAGISFGVILNNVKDLNVNVRAIAGVEILRFAQNDISIGGRGGFLRDFYLTPSPLYRGRALVSRTRCSGNKLPGDH